MPGKKWNGQIPACGICGKKNHKDDGFFHSNLASKTACYSHLMVKSWVNPGTKIPVLEFYSHYVRSKKDGNYYEANYYGQ